MLKTRVITALVILPIILVAVFAFPDWAWGLFTLAIVLVACWEWSRFCTLDAVSKTTYALVTALMMALVSIAYLRGNAAGIEFDVLKVAAFALAALFWLVLVPIWLVRSWRPVSVAWQVLAGWLVILPTWLAFLSLRSISPWLLLSFAAIVWVADIAAYFVGRAFGQHKLAPAISPGKTVEGALGGLAGVALFFLAWRVLTANTALRNEEWVRQLHSHGWILFALFILLAIVSVLGDLFESWMKRGAGLKDSSNLLPGHGGILDRIDALTSTLPLAGLYMWLMARTG